ncbi:MAG: hypothetical protein HQL19_06630, partial [Candidatus Omnitrophica bacterium]|nr:hypothetical protein [Candidatus Omnitrophota bacterium]
SVPADRALAPDKVIPILTWEQAVDFSNMIPYVSGRKEWLGAFAFNRRGQVLMVSGPVGGALKAHQHLLTGTPYQMDGSEVGVDWVTATVTHDLITGAARSISIIVPSFKDPDKSFTGEMKKFQGVALPNDNDRKRNTPAYREYLKDRDKDVFRALRLIDDAWEKQGMDPEAIYVDLVLSEESRARSQGTLAEMKAVADQEVGDFAQNGGIDLNPEHMALELQKNGAREGFQFSADAAQNVRIDGLRPVIIAIQPMAMPLREYLGTNTP